jgi:dipeptidyl aminopeptidase/acylaminoacyl peptidase
MSMPSKIGDDGELVDGIALEKPKNLPGRPFRLRSWMVALIAAQTIIIATLCGGGYLFVTGVLTLNLHPGCADCSTPAPSVATKYVPKPVLDDTPRLPTYTPTPLSALNIPNCTTSHQGEIATLSDMINAFGGVFLIDPTSLSICKFITDPDGISTLAWSANGASLAYVSSCGLKIEDVRNLTSRLLFSGDLDHAGIAWSPDGNLIAFAATPAEDGNSSTEIMSLDVNSGKTQTLTHAPGHDYAPDWSPDGKRIAFVSDRSGIDQIYIMDTDGSHLARMTSGESVEYTPAWSPDGTKIAYSNGDRVAIFDLNTQATQVLKTPNIRNRAPHWSPDGASIVYTSYVTGRTVPWLIAVAGDTPAHPLIQTHYDVWSPTWVR